MLHQTSFVMICLIVLAGSLLQTVAFSIVTTRPQPSISSRKTTISSAHHRTHAVASCTKNRSAVPILSITQLHMSSIDREKTRTTKKGVQTIDKTETKVEEKKKNEETWRVVLHNDEVHTFNYVVRSLTKVIGTLDRKAAFEICVATHGTGKATITKTWKKQAEQFCLGLQRQGLTVSISPDEDFEGGHSGGGL